MASDEETLVLSAEVKQFVLRGNDLSDLAEFGNLIAQHQALGLVVALGFEDGATEGISELGLHPVSRQDLIERVRLWDPLKQRIAINALLYYSGFREQSSALTKRIRKFVEGLEELGPSDIAPAQC